MIKGYNKDESWIEGNITTISFVYDNIAVDGETFSVKDVPRAEKKDLQVGDRIVMYFKTNKYHAVQIRVVSRRRNKMSKLEETQKLISEVEPYFDLSTLTPEERKEMRGVMIESVKVAANIYDTTATYDDTKKDISKIATTIVEIAVVLATFIDANSTQVLKRTLPPEK